MKYLLLLLLPLFSLSQIANTGLIPYRKADLWGLCDTSKKIFVTPQYDSVSFFSDELKGYSVKNKNLYGLISYKNEILIPVISELPIESACTGYLKSKSKGAIHYYSVKNHKHVKKACQTTEAPEDELARGDSESSSDIIGDTYFYKELQKYEKDKSLQVTFNPNKEYFKIEKKGRIKNINHEVWLPHGVYLPRIKKLLLGDSTLDYIDVIWNPDTKKYFIEIRKNGLYGVIDEKNEIIIPSDNKEPILLTMRCIIFNKPDSRKNYTLLLKRNIVVAGHFQYARAIYLPGKVFELFFTKIPEDSFISTKQQYLGENGLEYFEN